MRDIAIIQLTKQVLFFSETYKGANIAVDGIMSQPLAFYEWYCSKIYLRVNHEPA